MKKIIYKLINNAIEGVDVYLHNGSFWLIFTDRKEWVIELDKNGKLWYNYYFFENIFKYISLDVIENQHYITEWVEDTVRNGVMKTNILTNNRFVCVEDAIQNGVMTTTQTWSSMIAAVEDTIRNGVMTTNAKFYTDQATVEDTIQNEVIIN